MLKWIIGIILILIVAPVVVIGSWITTQEAFEATGDAEFCGTCHTMAPFVSTHHDDVHGGNNPQGLVAVCVDCHLPHDSRWGYLSEKMRSGLHDVWGQMTHWMGLNEIDWEAKLAESSRFVFDSGCLRCHAKLDREDNPQYRMHRPYFSGSGKLRCITCHKSVGHHALRDRLDALASKDDVVDADD